MTSSAIELWLLAQMFVEVLLCAIFIYYVLQGRGNRQGKKREPLLRRSAGRVMKGRPLLAARRRGRASEQPVGLDGGGPGVAEQIGSLPQ